MRSRRAASLNDHRRSLRAATQRWIVFAALLAVLAAACTGGDTEPEATPVRTPAPPPSTSEAIAGAEEASYLSLFNSVSLAAVESTRFLNQLAVFAAGSDGARADLHDDVRLLIDSFGLQLEQLEAAEPVPGRMEPAHASMKTAIGRYRAAAELLLPPRAGGPAVFEFSRFQELMMDGGHHFHGAGDLLP